MRHSLIFIRTMQAWMAHCDADEEIVYVYHNGQETIHEGFDNPLSAELVLPGFNLVLSELRV